MQDTPDAGHAADDGRPMDTIDADSPFDEVRRAIEAIVLVAEQSVESEVLAELLEVPVTSIDEQCRALAAEYEAEGRGFVLVPIAGGWRYQTHPDLAPVVERYVLDGQASRLSAAALETLAIIAYKQPISRNQVAAIRGVSADGVMRTLESRGYIAEFARDPGPGKAVLYGTTPAFLERLGLASLDELPVLVDFVPDTDVVEALERTLMVSTEPAIEAATAADAGGVVGEVVLVEDTDVDDPDVDSTHADDADVDDLDVDDTDIEGTDLAPTREEE